MHFLADVAGGYSTVAMEQMTKSKVDASPTGQDRTPETLSPIVDNDILLPADDPPASDAAGEAQPPRSVSSGPEIGDPSTTNDEAVVGYRGVTACHAAGISYRQLDYWARTGLVVPSIRDASGSGAQRLYSFRDLVVLKVVKRLLDAGVSLANIRLAIDTLRSRGAADLAGLTLVSDGNTVFECRSPEEIIDLLQGGQGVFAIAIGGAFNELQGSLSHLPDEPAKQSDDQTGAAEVGNSTELRTGTA